jgi:transcriptional regulator with XRE-family HTH domain
MAFLKTAIWLLFGHRPKGLVLTDAEIANIKRLSATGHYAQDDLADIFGVNQSTISRIVTGETHLRPDN